MREGRNIEIYSFLLPSVKSARKVPLMIDIKNLTTLILLNVMNPSFPMINGFCAFFHFPKVFASLLSLKGNSFQDLIVLIEYL